RAVQYSSIALLFSAGLLLASCTSDLRPRTVGATANQHQIERGLALLKRSADVHGAKAWKSRRTTSVDYSDAWKGFVANAFINPWPDADARVTMHGVNKTMHLVGRFRTGKLKGSSWGRLHAGRTYTVTPAGQRVFAERAHARFILAALHYFSKLPLRLQQVATRIAYADTVTDTAAGRATRYHRVIAGRGANFATNTKPDQYLVYINASNGRIEKVGYTV